MEVVELSLWKVVNPYYTLDLESGSEDGERGMVLREFLVSTVIWKELFPHHIHGIRSKFYKT